MSNFTKTKSTLTEAKVPNKALALKKELESSDWGYTIKGGNGVVKKKGKNLFIYDSFYYGEDKAKASLIKTWSKGGTDYEYFKDEMNMEIKVVSSGSDFFNKLFGKNMGACWVEIEVK